jgi:hypothetical protein
MFHNVTFRYILCEILGSAANLMSANDKFVKTGNRALALFFVDELV